MTNTCSTHHRPIRWLLLALLPVAGLCQAHAAASGAASSTPPAAVTIGQHLAEIGAPPETPACFSCHGPAGQGIGTHFPRIAGRPADFVITRIHEFQHRAQGATPRPGTMTAVASTLNETQIAEVAAYLSQLHPSTQH